MNRLKTLTRCSGIALSIALDMAAAPASAKLWALSISGTIEPDSDFLRMYNSSPIDKLGLFGAAGQDVGGAGFNLVYTINTSEPWAVTLPSGTDGSGTTVYSSGTNPYAQRGSAITASLTINGITIYDIGKASANSTSPTGVGSQQQIAASTFSSIPRDDFTIMTRAEVNNPGNTYNFNNKFYAGTPVFGVNSIFSNTSNPRFIYNGVDLYSPDQGFIPFSMYVDPSETAYYVNGHFDAYGMGSSTTLYFGASYISMQEITPAPEPGEWAMIIAGLAIVGGVSRRRLAV